MKTVAQFVSLLRQDGESIPEQAYVTIELDNARIRCPLSDLGSKTEVGHLGSKYAALVVGTKARVLLGNHDLIAEGKLTLLSLKLVQDLQARPIVGK